MVPVAGRLSTGTGPGVPGASFPGAGGHLVFGSRWCESSARSPGACRGFRGSAISRAPAPRGCRMLGDRPRRRMVGRTPRGFSTMIAHAIVRACGSDSRLLGSLGTAVSFDKVTTVSPHDSPATIFDGVLFGFNERCGSPATGCAVLECLRLASESTADVVALSESDVGWFDPDFPRCLAEPGLLGAEFVLSAGRSVNSWSSRFEGVFYWGWPLFGTPSAFRKLLSDPATRATVGPQYWCHSDRMVTRLSEITYTELRPAFGSSAVGYGLTRLVRSARSGVPVWHAVKTVADYETARSEYIRSRAARCLS